MEIVFNEGDLEHHQLEPMKVPPDHNPTNPPSTGAVLLSYRSPEVVELLVTGSDILRREDMLPH